MSSDRDLRSLPQLAGEWTGAPTDYGEDPGCRDILSQFMDVPKPGRRGGGFSGIHAESFIRGRAADPSKVALVSHGVRGAC